ncbi:MAG: metal-dependent hydrolase [Gammaproteobacteria bacterium]|nr:metal-dependent hydrolase [Gammaproteobacteria bacterium]
MFPRILLLTLLFWTQASLAAGVEVLWLGHATTRITSVEGKVIVIDPFLIKNPMVPAKYQELKALGKVDLILITHGHSDHTRDLIELATLTGAKVVAPYGFAFNMISLGLLPGEKTIGMNKGGTVEPLGKGIKVHMVPAEHGSGIDYKMPGLTLDPLSRRLREGGVAVGYVIEFEDGFRIYHSGDTAVFGDMELIREFYHPDLAMVCIGGHFTMDPAGAAYALRKFIQPKQVIPIHYGTYPVINRTPAELIEALGDAPMEVLDVKPGETVVF